MKTLDDLRAEMPLVFELLDDIQIRIAKEKAAHYAEMAMLRERLDPDEFEELASEKEGRFYLSMKPMNAQVDAIMRQISNVLACEPISVMLPSASPAETSRSRP